jgi:histidine ammonia-lyase
MACHAARRLDGMNENLSHIVAIELLAGIQGVEFRRPLTTSPMLESVIREIREHVPGLAEDRAMSGDIMATARMLRDGQLIFPVPGDTLPTIVA